MRIKELRKQTNLTQTQFGELFGIPMRTIQEWEGGSRKPPEYVINMIEELLYRRGLINKEIA
jgi:DNA-binding transcriptional regulator YiaG